MKSRSAERMPQTLLCAANFPSNTGFAWNFIEGLYARLADRLAEQGVRTLVAYPSLESPPGTLRGSAARAIELEVDLEDRKSVHSLADFVRREGVRVLYLADRPAWSLAFPTLRRAGVRHIIVHDHTSGDRAPAKGFRRTLKRWSRRIPGTVADQVIAVSRYVARRKETVDLIPRERLRVIWNSVEIRPLDTGARARLHALFGIDESRRIVACACRAAPQKGLDHLLRAFDRLLGSMGDEDPAPLLLYFGDGPLLADLEALRASLPAAESILFAGYRNDAARLVEGADLCVVPSTWEEAFGLAALEPMERGVPVVASNVGGLPEVVVDGETGLLVPPGDEAELARAMRELLTGEERRRRLARAARRRAEELFSLDRQLEDLYAAVRVGFNQLGDSVDRRDAG
ncbi:MAG: glycosyltransferase family 4 protein [Gemmatimonadota bacterium]